MQRHRTAIFLVGGWLLMVPRIDTKTGTVHKDSPVGTWNVERAYDTAHECEDGRRDYYAGANSKRVAAVFLSGRCVPAEHIYPPRTLGEIDYGSTDSGEPRGV